TANQHADDGVGRVESVLSEVLSEHAALDSSAVTLMSGGVDSTLIQALWKKAASRRPAVSVTATVDHDVTRTDQLYAQSAAKALGTDHREVEVGQSVESLLIDHVKTTGEPPN